MGTKAQELESGCFAKAADDEPLFVLRAQDAIAPHIVRTWAQGARAAGVNEAKVVEAEQLAARMEQWQNENRRKIPD